MRGESAIKTSLLDTSEVSSGSRNEWMLLRPESGGAIIYVLGGAVTVNTDRGDYRLQANSLLTLLHGSEIRIHSSTEDFQACFISYSDAVVCDADLLAHLRNSAGVISRHPVVPLLNPAHIKLFESYCGMMHEINLRTSLTFRAEIVKNMLEAVLFSIDGIYRDNFPPRDTAALEKVRHTRQEETTERFYTLVASNYMTERSTAFYAGRLCITPKHLAVTVKAVSGLTPSEIISRAVITDAKSKLKSTGMSVGEISDSLNFPNPSFFCKYFRKHMGISPRKYRNNVDHDTVYGKPPKQS